MIACVEAHGARADADTVKVLTMDEVCRREQHRGRAHDGIPEPANGTVGQATSSRSAGDYHSLFPPEPILWG